jgi:dsRNA-specific ribonuclease
MRTDRRRQILKEAWTGDAVLALFAREMILREDGNIDGEKAVRLTSNQFLTAFGDPSEVEAEIGRVYEERGLSAAFEFIAQRILPTFRKRESKRLKPDRRLSASIGG